MISVSNKEITLEKLTIQIECNKVRQEPIIVESVTWETARKGEPSKLVFTCIKDDKLSFSEGSPVRAWYGEQGFFSGFVFEKSRNKDHHITVTCYDQLRYLQNKTTYRWKGLRADQIVQRIAKDFKLEVGELANTKYKIPTFDKPNMSLFDMILDAFDETVLNTGKLFYLYDDFGKLTVKEINESKLDVLFDQDTAEDFDYVTSIDKETYNRIVITEESSNSGKGVYVHRDDEENIKKWGVLQYFEDNYKGINAKVKADALMKLYNRVKRSLTIKRQFGDINVRGGTSVYLDLNLGDMIAQKLMLVEKVTHTFKDGEHYMDVSLQGCEEFYD